MSRYLLVPLALLLLTPSLSGQESEEAREAPDQGPDLSFGLDLGIGVQSFEDPETGEIDTYQSLSLLPDLGIGPFGLGVDLTLNYRFTGGDDNDQFEVREEDWVPTGEITILELYLPKFRYIRYGTKGDPLFALFGSYSDARLGNGFLVSNYSNEQFLPERRQFGFQLDVDGAGVGFPYFGAETFVSNVASFDLFGTRLFLRPLADLTVPLLPELQIGATVALDTNPAYHVEKDPDSPYFEGADPDPATGLPAIEGEDNVITYGFDLTQPVLRRDLISLSAFGDLALQNEAIGGMVGAGGRAVRILDYTAQIRFLGDNFIPEYFDSAYDLRRIERYAVYDADETVIESYTGWLARVGLNILQELMFFQIGMSGPFSDATDVYPELEAAFRVNQGLVPFFSFDAFYRKLVIEEPEDIWDPENAIIGARLNYASSPVVISLTYDVRYDPYDPDEQWKVTSGLQSTISLY